MFSLAAGDRPRQLIGEVVSARVLLGCVLGVGGAVGAFVLIRGVLYGSVSLTMVTFAAAPMLLLGVATLALFVPARRAAQLDAQRALRQD